MSSFVGKRRSTEASIVVTSVEVAIQRLDAQGDAVGPEVDLGKLVVNPDGYVTAEFPNGEAQDQPGFKLLVRERGRDSRTTVTELRFEDAVVEPEEPEEPELEIPNAPHGLIAADVTRTRALLTWMPPEGDVPIHHYEVFLDGEHVGSTNKLEFPLVMLDPGDGLSHRLVAVRAVSNYGVGSFPTAVEIPVPSREEPEEPGENPWPELGTVGFLGDPSTLTPMRSGAIRTEGTVIEGRRIDCSDGELGIHAKNVIIRNCIIDCGIWGVYAYNDVAEGLVIEDCTFIGGYQAAIGLEQLEGWIVRRCDFYDGRDAIKPGGSGLIDRCTMHDPATGGDAHNDCLQFSDCDGVTVRRNLLMGADTSCIAMFENQGTFRNVTIEDNWLGGAGYLIYAGGETGHNIVIRNNTMGRYGYQHPVTSWDQKVGHIFSGNVYEDGSAVSIPQG